MKRRARLPGRVRAQRGWKRNGTRTTLPGLHWRIGSVLSSSRSPQVILEELRSLWFDHGNIGALRDAFWLCGKLTEPAWPMPEWLVTAIDSGLTNPFFARCWKAYYRDMVDLHRFDLFELSHVHGVSRQEAAQFVVDAEKDAGRGDYAASVASVLRLTTEVPRRAKHNPGRYYIAASFPFFAGISDDALAGAQEALHARRPDRVFVTARRVSRKRGA